MRRGRDRRHRLGQARGRRRTSACRCRRGATHKRRPAMRTKRRSIRHLLSAFLTEHRSTFRDLAFVTAKSIRPRPGSCCATWKSRCRAVPPHAPSAPNMGHMAHLSRLPGSTSWGISISKEPVGTRPLNGRKLRTEVSPHNTQRHPPRLRIATYTNGSNNPRRRDVTDRQGGRHHEE